MASTPTIRAIETRYAGCRFRSRLEARWAVFFDHLVPVVDHLERGCPAAYAAARSARFEHGAIA